MLTQNMCVEWAPYNIRLTVLAWIFCDRANKPIRVEGHPFNEFIVNRTPAGMWGTLMNCKGAAIFLSSKASDFVNGQILYVDGGILATIGKPSNE